MIRQHQVFNLYEKSVFEKAVIEPPFRIMAQMPNEACFYYLTTGKATVFTSTEVVKLETKNGLVLKCGNYLNEYLESAEVGYCEAIAVHFYPEVLQMLYAREFPDFLQKATQIQPSRYSFVRATELLQNYISSLQFYFDNPDLVSDELLQLKLKELILLLAKTDNLETIHQLMREFFSEETIYFKRIVEAHLYRNLSMQELASLCHLSLSSFKRAFQKHYGSSPAKYIMGRKLEKARKLLRHSDHSISEVALECGFSTLTHLSKVFQRHFQVSPSHYRMSQKS